VGTGLILIRSVLDIAYKLKTDHAMLFEMGSNEEWVYDKKFGYLKPSILGAEPAK
jgi:hypothetical protein